jgi:MoxR-like ATPase
LRTRQSLDGRERIACVRFPKVLRTVAKAELTNVIVAAQVIGATRTAKSVFLGASPRASVSALIAAKSIAAMQGRDFVTPDDILFVIKPVLRHRIMLTPEKEMEGLTPDEVIDQIVQGIEIPR